MLIKNILMKLLLLALMAKFYCSAVQTIKVLSNEIGTTRNINCKALLKKKRKFLV